MTKRQDLCSQRRSRSEQSDQRQPNQAANIFLQPRASPDSTSLASRIGFPTMTAFLTAEPDRLVFFDVNRRSRISLRKHGSDLIVPRDLSFWRRPLDRPSFRLSDHGLRAIKFRPAAHRLVSQSSRCRREVHSSSRIRWPLISQLNRIAYAGSLIWARGQK